MDAGGKLHPPERCYATCLCGLTTGVGSGKPLTMGLSAVTYNAPLVRYIASAETLINQVAFYDAPIPGALGSRSATIKQIRLPTTVDGATLAMALVGERTTAMAWG